MSSSRSDLEEYLTKNCDFSSFMDNKDELPFACVWEYLREVPALNGPTAASTQTASDWISRKLRSYFQNESARACNCENKGALLRVLAYLQDKKLFPIPAWHSLHEEKQKIVGSPLWDSIYMVPAAHQNGLVFGAALPSAICPPVQYSCARLSPAASKEFLRQCDEVTKKNDPNDHWSITKARLEPTSPNTPESHPSRLIRSIISELSASASKDIEATGLSGLLKSDASGELCTMRRLETAFAVSNGVMQPFLLLINSTEYSRNEIKVAFDQWLKEFDARQKLAKRSKTRSAYDPCSRLQWLVAMRVMHYLRHRDISKDNGLLKELLKRNYMPISPKSNYLFAFKEKRGKAKDFFRKVIALRKDDAPLSNVSVRSL